MSIEMTVESLKKMKLTGIVNTLEEQLKQPNTYQSLAFEERLSMLVLSEESLRTHKKIKRFVTQAKFKIPALPEQIDYQHPRGLVKAELASLLQSDWLESKQNILFNGATGCGKTFLACAIGYHACQKGYSVRYFRVSKLLEVLTLAHADGSYPKTLKQLAQTDLLILDDWALNPFTSSQRTDFLEIMEKIAIN